MIYVDLNNLEHSKRHRIFEEENKVILEVSIGTDPFNRSIKYHLMTQDDDRKHGPRVKIIRGNIDHGTVPALEGKILDLDGILDHKHYEIDPGYEEYGIFAAGYTMYAREVIIEYYYSNGANYKECEELFIIYASKFKGTNSISKNKVKKVLNKLMLI